MIDKIKDFENIINFKFPSDYKEFLIKNNVESIIGKIYDFTNIYGDIDTSNIRNVYTFIEGEDNIATTYDWELEMENTMEGVIPIVCDEGDNLICISLRKNDYGKIYFIDHEIGVENGEEDMAIIANSFKEFLDLLRDDI